MLGQLRQQYHIRDIQGVFHVWDVNKLLKLNIDQESLTMDLEKFRDQFESEYWTQGKSLKCSEVTRHAQLIFEADLSYPILVGPDLKMIDGMHRLCKAFLQGRPTIQAVILKELPPPDYMNVALEDLPY